MSRLEAYLRATDPAFVAKVEAELAEAKRRTAFMGPTPPRPVKRAPMNSKPGPAPKGSPLWHIRRMSRIAMGKP